MKNCIMFVTHTVNGFIKSQIAKILNDLIKGDKNNEYELYILFNYNTELKSSNLNIYTFNLQTVQNAGFKLHQYYYNSPISFYGHNFEYSFMSFYKDHPNFDFYWLIEWDVYNSGNWYDLFSYYDNNHRDVDFYSTHIDYGESDGWQDRFVPLANYKWIKSFKVTRDNLCKCFNPIDRFSNKALQVLCDSYEKGDYGFYEVVMPTIFYNNHLNIKAFGKSTEYKIDNRFIDDYLDEHQEFINDTTVQYAHKYKFLNEIDDGKVYHPVKTFLK